MAIAKHDVNIRLGRGELECVVNTREGVVDASSKCA